MNDYLKRFSLEGKRAMVTGASKGIGAEIASLLAEAGAAVAIVGRDKAGLAQTAAKVTAAGRDCLTIEADLATPEFRPRALFERFNIEVLCTTDAATDPLTRGRSADPRSDGPAAHRRPTSG